MKVVVIYGSPRKRGSSRYLCEKFIEGLKENQNEVFEFDACFTQVGSCLACNYCQKNDKCVQNDDMQLLYPHLLAADVICFSSPLYYFGLSSQIKKVIDRFYAINDKLMGKKKTILLLTSGGDKDRNVEGCLLEFELFNEYMNFTNIGNVYAPNISCLDDLLKTKFPNEAYQLGKKIK